MNATEGVASLWHPAKANAATRAAITKAQYLMRHLLTAQWRQMGDIYVNATKHHADDPRRKAEKFSCL